jgi:hypothetical protein
MQLDAGFTLPGFLQNLLLQLVAVVGTLLVAWLIYVKTRDDQWAIFREERDTERSARKELERAQQRDALNALHNEIDDNLRRLRVFWVLVVGKEEGTNLQKAERLHRAAVPLWSTAVWLGSAPLIATAMQPGQLVDAYRIYTTLADIVEVQRRLDAADARDSAIYQGDPALDPGIGSPMKFLSSANLSKAAGVLMPEVDERVRAGLKRGNPVSLS